MTADDQRRLASIREMAAACQCEECQDKLFLLRLLDEQPLPHNYALNVPVHHLNAVASDKCQVNVEV